MNYPGSIPLAEPGETKSREAVGSYATYGEAQQAVDYLADARFPVEHTEIVGRDLSFVERVNGRWTTGRAALAGAGSGAWFGLFVGLFVGIFTADAAAWLWVNLGGILIGAFWGAIFALVARWVSGGERDFSSAAGLAAESYELMVVDQFAERARQLLSRLAA